MPDDNEFSSTMRIDIPPDLLKDTGEAAKLDTSKIRVRPATQRMSRAGAEAGQSKYEQLLQSIYDASVITDLQGHIVDSNIRATEFLLYQKPEFNKLTILDIISGSDISLLNTLCQNLQNEKFALLQAYCLRKDRTYFPAEIAVNLLRFEDKRLCFFIRDVSVRRQAEEMLRTEHNAIQNAGNGIAIVDDEAKIEYVNPAVARMWGFESADALLGTYLRDLIADQQGAETMINAVLGDHESWSGELIAKKKDGESLTVQVAAACNRDSDGEVVGMVLSFVDITDRKKLEEAERQAERQRVMLASVGAACHHLGQPATVIMANIELIKRMTKDVNKEELKDLLRMTSEAADTLADVLHKLNAVNEYRTVQYLDGESPESPENVILDI